MYVTVSELRKIVAARGLRRANLVPFRDVWYVQVFDHGAQQVFELSTARDPGGARAFKSVEPALTVLRDVGISDFTVMWPETEAPRESDLELPGMWSRSDFEGGADA